MNVQPIQRKVPGPKQMQWARDHIPAFRELEAVMNRIREEQAENKREMNDAKG